MVDVEDLSDNFGAVDYTVFASVLVISIGIGVYYGFFGNKNQTSDDFLMGGRSMPVFPVALSLFCSFVSAITLLGNPVEVYYYGSQYVLIAIGFIPITFALSYLFVPTFFNLQLTSAYEYFELRFNRSCRMFMSVICIIYLLLLSSIWVYGPSLALEQTAGLNRYLVTGLTFVVCIFYSSLGGLKAVLWTDAFQALLMLGSVCAVIGKGITDMGGMSVVWERAENSSRTEFFNFDPDLRTRHTFWTGTIGGYLMWIPLYAATQSQIQRYLSVPTLSKARQAIWINMFGLIAIVILCFLAGLVIYAKYYTCDPIGADIVENADQLLPLFVMETLGDYPGLPGLFVAGITGASLSSVSSALNALSAVITEDYVKKWRPEMTDSQLSKVSKLVSVVSGALSFGFVFIAEFMGDIFPIALSMVGTFLGPTLGLFSLGMFFPWANALGSLVGTVCGLLLTLVISAGSIIWEDEIPDQKLALSQEGCDTGTLGFYHARVNDDWKNSDDSFFVKVISLAPTWYPGLGNISTIIFGLIFSLLLRRFQDLKPVPRKYISPPVLRLYDRVFSTEYLDKWIEASTEKGSPQVNDKSTIRNSKSDEKSTV